MKRRPYYLLWLLLPVATLGMISGPTGQQRDMLQSIDEGSILAWARHITGQDPNDLTSFDKFESVAVIPGSSNRANGDARHDDEVWVVAKRTVDGNDVRYIEQFQSLDWGDDPNYCWFVDCGRRYTCSGRGQYPTLQELTDAEIPDAPALPADTELVTPVSVTDAAGLQAMHPGHHYSIDADIDLIGVVWTPLVFNSASAIVIEGNNHTISGLTLTSAGATHAGFISLIDGAGGGQIRNLNFNNCSVSAYREVGVFCGDFQPDSSTFLVRDIHLENCTVTGTGTYPQYLGILFGRTNVEATYIANCTATNCTVTGEGTTQVGLVGGLMGAHREAMLTTNYIIDCDVVGGNLILNTPVTLNSGGFIGSITASGGASRWNQIFDSSTSMDILQTGTSGGSRFASSGIGGFGGYVTNLAATSCAATGDLTFSAGGVWVTPASYYRIGGFLGNTSCNETYTNCWATGKITLDDTGTAADVQDIGGFAGYGDYDFQVLRCYATGDIEIAGNIDTAIDVGGFVGELNTSGTTSVIQRSWSEGDILITGNVATSVVDVAGFLGSVNTYASIASDILNCYAWGSIIANGSYPANSRFAGFVGSWDNKADQSFVNCYCAQTDIVTGSGYTGQIPPGSDSHGFGALFYFPPAVFTVTASYYDTQTSSLDTSLIAEAKTTNWLQTKDNFEAAGWNFDAIWYLPSTPASQEIIDQVCVYADGLPRGTFTMDRNDIADFNEADYSVVIAGLNYYSILETESLHRGPGLGRQATIQSVQANFHETMGAHVGADMTYSADWRFYQKDFLMKSGSARDANGTVGLPYSGEPFAAGEEIYLYGTTNYDGLHTLAADTNNVELRLTAPYVAETFDGTEWVISNTPPGLFSSYKGPAPFLRGTNRQPDVYLWIWDPVPMTIRSITANMEVTFE